MVITVRNVVAARLCFHRHLSFCSQGGQTLGRPPTPQADPPPPGRHPPGQTLPGQTPPGQTPPVGRHTPGRHLPWTDTPWADTPLGRHPLPSACWDTQCPVVAGLLRPLQRTVRILLECNVVIYCLLCK